MAGFRMADRFSYHPSIPAIQHISLRLQSIGSLGSLGELFPFTPPWKSQITERMPGPHCYTEYHNRTVQEKETPCIYNWPGTVHHFRCNNSKIILATLDLPQEHE